MENVHVQSARDCGRGGRLARRFGGESPNSAYPMRACSACAGDYEDPDRTAGTDEEDVEPEDDGAENDDSQTE